MWNDLYEELIVEILSRLPTKSLLRFRSLSKSLCACIGSPSFIRLHTLRSPNKVMVIHRFRFNRQAKDMYTLHSLSCTGIPPDEFPFRSYSHLVGSCNGILCVYEYHNNGVHLWNPSIRRKVSLHDRPSWSDYGWPYIPLGFGFDPIVDDYKILMRAKKGGVVSTFVYTIKTDTWREIAHPDTQSAYTTLQCLFNGALHWAINRNLTFSGDDARGYILAFDLSSEVFSTIKLPEPSWQTNQVTIINGSLAVLSSKHDNQWIWVRSNTSASWSVAYKLNRHEFGHVYTVFQLTASDDLLFIENLNLITIYNPKTRAQSKFVELSGSCYRNLLTLCVESLGLLDMGTSYDQGSKPPEQKRSRTSETIL